MINRGISSSGMLIPKNRIKRPDIQQARKAVLFKGFAPGLAQSIYNAVPNPKSFSIGPFSYEDLTARLMTWTIYLPQGAMAIYYRQNPFEVNFRNVSVWLGSVFITILAKHPQFGFNAILNKFMVPKKLDATSPWEKFLNHFRPDENYLEIMDKAGIKLGKLGYSGKIPLSEAVLKDAYWAKPDLNEMRLLDNLAKMAKSDPDSMKEVSKAGGGVERLTETAIRSVMKRIVISNYMSVAASAALMAVVLGILFQKFVFAFISPLDHKFFPNPKTKKVDPEPFPPAAPTGSPKFAYGNNPYYFAPSAPAMRGYYR